MYQRSPPAPPHSAARLTFTRRHTESLYLDTTIISPFNIHEGKYILYRLNVRSARPGPPLAPRKPGRCARVFKSETKLNPKPSAGVAPAPPHPRGRTKRLIWEIVPRPNRKDNAQKGCVGVCVCVMRAIIGDVYGDVRTEKCDRSEQFATDTWNISLVMCGVDGGGGRRPRPVTRYRR
ncbi:hypothetical protein EVAR_7251_1 [Eumeta japonica]|uniref:Uncharacterized protein n=1 Tax=Eumeta variegata TaxID=151549 RepID=A0A4C1T5A7_EUMVA|nr:hypothetical protein EVAR_7251_1 [Eumeta japonica]